MQEGQVPGPIQEPLYYLKKPPKKHYFRRAGRKKEEKNKKIKIEQQGKRARTVPGHTAHVYDIWCLGVYGRKTISVRHHQNIFIKNLKFVQSAHLLLIQCRVSNVVKGRHLRSADCTLIATTFC